MLLDESIETRGFYRHSILFLIRQSLFLGFTLRIGSPCFDAQWNVLALLLDAVAQLNGNPRGKGVGG